MSYQERAKNIFLKHGTGAGDLASVIMKLEDQSDQMAKQCVAFVEEIGELRAELEKFKVIDVSLIPNKWTLERFKGLCDIKMPEAAMVSGPQLLELLKDSARLDWLLNHGCALHEGLMGLCSFKDPTREDIDAAMEAENK